MVKHSQTIRWQKQTNCLSVFEKFVGFGIKGLPLTNRAILNQISVHFSICKTSINHLLSTVLPTIFAIIVIFLLTSEKIIHGMLYLILVLLRATGGANFCLV